MVGAAPCGASVKVLTVAEPWLTCIVRRSKNIENRGIGLLSTMQRLEGERIGLHGAMRWSSRGASDPRVCAVFGGLVDPPARVAGYNVHPHCDGFGLIVATAQIGETHRASQWCDPRVCFPWGEAEYTNADGSVVHDVIHIPLEDVVELDCVIPARGRLGLWHCAELDELVA